MEAPVVDFQNAREYLHGLIKQCLQCAEDDKNVEKIEDFFIKPGDKKAALEQAFRDTIKDIIVNNGKAEEFYSVLNMAAIAVSKEMTTASILFILMQDVFDCITLDRCEEMFSYLEQRVSLWKSETYYNAGKNYLLRMCNDLLRRLSRSKNTVFCGRIQLFLAKLFPLSEKSGLNLMSQFNLENITLYNTKAEDYERIRKQSIEDRDESMEVEEGEADDHPSNIPIDYNMYRKFWSLQDYFRKPAQCYDKAAWDTFTSYTDDVLSCFESFKLDDMKSQKNKSKPVENDMVDAKIQHVYFPKYLTSEKLLDLQLSDSNFRRNMLLQLLIVFQYLQAQVKFKSTTQILSDEQSSWMKPTIDRVMQVLRETPPEGEKFAETVQHILSREDNWNNWKNDGCPTFVKELDAIKTHGPQTSKKRSIGDDMKACGGKLIKMGNPELTRLWNLCPDNMEACRNKQKNVLPSLEEFFEEAIEQLDPEAMIEEEYRLTKNPTFAWKSLRLLSRTSPHFFAQTPNQQKKKNVSEYLEGMLDKIAKEMPSSQSFEPKTEDPDGDNDAVENEAADSSIPEDQLGDQKADEGEQSPDKDELFRAVTKDQLKELSCHLADEWRKLGTELGLIEDELAYFESETDVKEEQAMKMLVIWMEKEPEKVTVETMRNALIEIGQEKIAVEVFGECGDS